ncbi:hypothetical protein Cgig2_010682 [Carnegiea gigantea]|uniref:Aspergillus nuclease S1 n=1 Tax=Carnegiea gigantea TaxID=171969 RepID=A0A9Q1KKR5_9CARY|nr:hypothetical protein Cgig2_010682 [Carnegiea gigantea]
MSLKFTLLSLFLEFLCPLIHGWGIDGHTVICTIAQSRLSEAANDAVKELLPEYAEGDFGSVCSWADRVKFRYHWSSPLHYINVPDSLCNFQYNRDCEDEDGVRDRANGLTKLQNGKAAVATSQRAQTYDYFFSRLPIANQRLAQAAVRLAATLNRFRTASSRPSEASNPI